MRRFIVRSVTLLLAAGTLLGVAPAAVQAAPAPVNMTFNAAPEPLLQGRTITLAGRVWNKATGNRQPVLFYFRRAGTPTWTYVGRATANDRGQFTRTATARFSGTWKAVRPATAARQAAERLDAVDVVRRAPRRIASYSGTTSSWSSPTIRIPTADYRAYVAYRCTDPSGGFMHLRWHGQQYGFEVVSSSQATGTLTLNGHYGARGGHFEVSTWMDCSWWVNVYAGTVFQRV